MAITAIVIAQTSCASAPSVGHEQTIRVASYNIQYGGKGIDQVIAAIKSLDADIIALQEVDVHWSSRSAFMNQATLLSRRLGMEIRFAPIYQLPPSGPSSPPREFGVALLTRYPIVAFTNRNLTRLSTQEANAHPIPMPGLLDVTIDVRGTRIRVLNTHLDYRSDPTVRQTQVAEIVLALSDSRLPTLLMGDLNAQPGSAELQPLFQSLRDTWTRSAGEGFTYPSSAPVRKIDYVLASPAFRVRSSRVAATEASDHRPVIVDLHIYHTQ